MALAIRQIRDELSFHPQGRSLTDITPEIDMGGTAVSLSLKSGEVWVFRHASEAQLSVEASVYLEKGRLKPRATKQIVLSDTVLDYSASVAWTLSRAQDGTRHLRDIEPDDLQS